LCPSEPPLLPAIPRARDSETLAFAHPRQQIITALAFASAAAFAPAPVARTATAVKAFESEVGSQAPLNFWDPLGLVADGDKDKFDRLRYVELKHGRISMLAVLGQVVTKAGIRLPGDIVRNPLSREVSRDSIAAPVFTSSLRRTCPARRSSRSRPAGPPSRRSRRLASTRCLPSSASSSSA
jgi:hypothetical protein